MMDLYELVAEFLLELIFDKAPILFTVFVLFVVLVALTVVNLQYHLV